MRAMRTVALFLLLGAIATICVSWAFAALGSMPVALGVPRGSSMPAFVKQGEVVPWPMSVPSEWPVGPMTVVSRAGRGLRQDFASAISGINDLLSDAPSTRIQYSLSAIRCGWPMEALNASAHVKVLPDGSNVISRTPTIRLPGWFQNFAESNTRGYRGLRSLPLKPIPAGFATNTILYAFTFWLLLRARFVLRAMLRRRRNQCVECGYPIGKSPVCSECGHLVPTTARDSTPQHAAEG